jgi:hypothetical protein
MAETKDAKNRPTYAVEAIKNDTETAVFLGDQIQDNMMTAMVALASETWATRKRQFITEALMEKHAKVTRAMIEQYVPTPEEEAEWAKARDVFISATFSSLMNGRQLAQVEAPSLQGQSPLTRPNSY